jgi:hypothetical protein
MQMKNDEIVTRYKQAKDKGEQVKILAQLNDCPVEQIIGILTAAGIDHRCFSGLRRKMNKEAEEAAGKIPYKKPEIIPGPPVPDKQLTVSDAVAVIKAELADINRQQYELDMRKADLYQQIWDMMGEM